MFENGQATLERINEEKVLYNFHNSLPMPVLFFKDGSVNWCNDAAKDYPNDKKISRLIYLKISTCEDPITSICIDNLRYKLSIHPYLNGYFVSIYETEKLIDDEHINFKENLATSLSRIVRSMAHRNVHSVVALRIALEEAERYKELENLDTITEETYKVLKAATLYYEYTKLLEEDLKEIRVNLTDELSALFSSIKVAMQRSLVPFSWKLPENGVACKVDMERLSFTILQLISNAFYFTTPGNEVKIVIDIDSNQNLIISIHDKGVGFLPDKIEKAKEEFYSFDPNIGGPVGIGLGLTYVNLFTQRCGGSLNITSSKYQTAVVMKLPVEYIELKETEFHSNKVKYDIGKYSLGGIILANIIDPVLE